MESSSSSCSENAISKAQEILIQQFAESGLLPLDRVKVGNALSALGDPRFQADRWFLPKGNGFGFVRIPEGGYSMGDKALNVHVPTFYIAQYQTTVAQFRAFVDDTAFEPGNSDCLSGTDNHPVPWVSWYEAFAYTQWLGGKLESLAKSQLADKAETLLPEQREMWVGLAEGSLKVCLPSEPEWEKAALGDTGSIFPWGDEIDVSYANFKESMLDATTAVGSFPKGASPFGVLDMSGNAWDWLRTVWGPSLEEPSFSEPYNYSDGREDLDASSNMLRCMRGGGFPVETARAKSRHRDAVLPNDRDDADSFRVVLTTQL
jgi:formylglycine-generating enzyme required for sulfatase activity